MRRIASLSLVAFAALAGCGGNVVVDSEPGATTSSSSTSGSTTTPQTDLTCTSVCQKIAFVCGSGQADCAEGCALTDKLGNELCHDAYQAFLACAFAAPETQCNSTGCQQETSAFTLCLTDACSAKPSVCTP